MSEKEITWEDMLRLRKKDIKPFEFIFFLNTPVDKNGEMAFATLKVLEFRGNNPVVECDGDGPWLAKSADKVYARII